MNIPRILKNKWLWVAVVFVFIGYQLMDDFLSYDLGERRKEGDDVIKATNAGSTMQD